MLVGLSSIGLQEMSKFVLAHEIAHHLNGDTESRVSWCEQQKREARADAYGAEVLSRGGEWPSAAVPLMFIFADAEDFSADDRNRTHPAAIKRELKLIDATRKQYAKHPQMAKETMQGHEQEFLDGLKMLELTRARM